MPPSEATPADIAAVAAHLEGTPAPQAPAQSPPAPQQPAPQPQAPQAPQMQPAPVANQPAPTSQPQDPFAAFVQPTPQPAQPTQPTQPTEPTPTPQPTTPPAEPSQPAPQTPTAPEVPGQSGQGEPQIQSFEEYMKSVTEGVEDAPVPPDPANINPDDPAAIKGFFDELLTTAEQRFEAKFNRKQAIQASERQLWDGAFEKYPSLKPNKNLRDMVHSIRMGYFQRGQAITPTQAADKLLESLGQQYKQGAADASVVSTIEQVQPQGGGTGAPIPTTADVASDMVAVQDGGETALANILDREIAAGRL